MRKSIEDIVRETFLIMGISLAAGIVANFSFVVDLLRGEKVLPIDERQASIPRLAPEITLSEAKTNFDNNGAIFLDARPKGDFVEGHILGAINVPWDNFDDVYPEISNLLSGEMEIITYCGGACESSIYLANALVKMGYRNVKVFFSGWPRWVEAGYPVGP
ncbi:MAG: rhodanese-like domain-containing protein [bacterium]